MKHNKRILIFLALAAFILLGFVWLSPMAFTDKDTAVKDKDDVNNPSIGTPAPYDPITATATVLKTGWNTYSNPQYGFAFEYPADYELSVHTPDESNALLSLSVAPKNDSPLDTAGLEQFNLSLSVYKGTIADIIKQDGTTRLKDEDASIKDIYLNGFSGTLITSKYAFTGEFMNAVILSKDDNGTVIYVSYFQNAGNDNAQIIPNSVLDTVLQSIRSYP